MSSGAAFHLPPAFPERAAWGTASKLRAWQQEALDAYLGSVAARLPRGRHAGRRQDDLRPARRHRAARARASSSAVTVVAPTEHLKTQWADAAARVGISLDPKFSNSVGRHSDDYHGVAVTYAAGRLAARRCTAS